MANCPGNTDGRHNWVIDSWREYYNRRENRGGWTVEAVWCPDCGATKKNE